MQDAKGWSQGSSVIAEPGIEQARFGDEVPEFLAQVTAGFDPLKEHFEGLRDYLSAAGFDDSGRTQVRIDEAIEGLDSAQQAMEGARDAAEDYIGALSGPHFDRV